MSQATLGGEHRRCGFANGAAERLLMISQEGDAGAGDLPIIAMTADAFSEDIQRSLDSGMEAGMRIERIDDKTVKCFLSNEELEEYEISYKDFIMRSDKAREVVAEIIEQATEEVGYQPPRFAFDLQIMMLPEQGMVLTFSEKGPEEPSPGRDLLECLKEVRNILERKNKSKEKEQQSKKQQSEKQQSEKQEREITTFAVFRFQSMRAVSEYARSLPGNLRISSALYRMDGAYYLYLDKGTASYERYSRACIQAMEFGTLYTAEHAKTMYLEEHGECLIADHAVKKLRF